MPAREFYLGNTILIAFSFLEPPETVVAVARQSDAAVEDIVTLDVQPVSPLSFTATFVPAVAGRWYVHIEATGTNAAVQEFVFDVIPSHIFDEGALVGPIAVDVARLLRARTKDSNGAELGVFDATTRPTGDEVDRLIEDAYSDVTARIGVHVAPRFSHAARGLVALRAAMFVELSYWPEQVRDNQSPYEQYRQIYEDRMKALQAAIAGDLAQGGPEGLDRFGSLRLRSPFAWPSSDYWPEPENPANWPDPLHAPGDIPTSGTTL